jgi:drug/metabolite transporter (DMT)-like permease
MRRVSYHALPIHVGATTSRLLLLLAAGLFSTGGAAIKALHGLDGVQRASFRSAFAAAFLLIVLPESRRLPTPRTLLVGACYAATMVTFVLANTYATSATAIFVQDLAPLVVLLLSPWVLNEPVKRRDVLFLVALGACFAVLLLAPEQRSATATDPAAGMSWAIASCVGWGCTLLGLRLLAKGQRQGDPDPSAQALVTGNVLACLVVLPFALPVGHVSAPTLVLLAYLGVVQIGLAYVCLTRGLRHVPALEASLLLMIEPVLNPLWSWLAHGEVPSGWTLAAGAGIVVATAVQALTQPRPLRP